MRFQLPSALVALTLLTSATLAQDAGVSSIVSEVDSIKSELYALTTATGTNALAEVTSLGIMLGSFIASVSTNSDWPAASSILMSQAATDSAILSSIRSSLGAAESSITSAASSAASSQSAAAGSATSSGLAPMVTAGISGMMAIGVLGAAVLL
jgi:hypothetical protein